MTEYRNISDLKVAEALYQTVENQILPGTGIESETVWNALADIVREIGPKNRALLEKRDQIQAEIDAWFKELGDAPIDGNRYRTFLEEIGYLVPEGGAFKVTTAGVDPEIATIAGPQLVVPVDKARYALNAANARWGSLFDALYGTDVVGEDGGAARGSSYNTVRGERVIAWANQFLDATLPLNDGSWDQVTGFQVADGHLKLALEDDGYTSPADVSACIGFRMSDQNVLESVLFCHNDLHIDIEIDKQHSIGQTHRAGIKDVVLESAITTIMDCEDSVAAVDAEDKATVYANWSGIMRGTLTTELAKGGKTITRQLNPDRAYQAIDGGDLVLPGRSMLLVRHVGAHLLTDAVTTSDGQPIAETLLDCVITTLGALHDIRNTGDLYNSRTGSMYIVKPKQHGPEEVALSVELFGCVERAYGLTENTLKIGIMDEERRTTVNLKECIRAAKDRIIFINTGFLDRTGDEIHTHMEAGPVIPKPEIKTAPWMLAYEDWNVDIGLETGLPGHGQIGKGMWAMPAEMAAMYASKRAHPEAGATCAWVPSPTAATLHAIHYHQVSVATRQGALKDRKRASLADILTPPQMQNRTLTAEAIRQELDNNAQGILGYVVRWVEQGVGCSTVPDINDIGLMEDRATLRISSQHIANWLHHGLVKKDEVIEAMQRMAAVVDRQNAGDPQYRNMAPDFGTSTAYQAALDLVFDGRNQPNGYTEHVLTRRRREFKDRRVS